MLLVLAGGAYLLTQPSRQEPQTTESAPGACAADSERAVDPAEDAREGEEPLKFIAADRQRTQVVFAALVYDTHGSDGTAPANPSAPTARQAGGYDGVYGGGLSSSGFGQGAGVVTVELSIAGSLLIGRITQPGCGTSSLSLTVSPNGDIFGSGRLYEGQDCSVGGFTATGKATGDAVTLEQCTTGGSMRGSLGRRGG